MPSAVLLQDSTPGVVFYSTIQLYGVYSVLYGRGYYYSLYFAFLSSVYPESFKKVCFKEYIHTSLHLQVTV